MRVEFIKTFSSNDLEKCFHFREFFHTYKISNQKKAQIKQHIQHTFHKTLEHQMIQDNCQIKFKNKKRKTQYIQLRNITPLLIGQSEIIYFY